MYLHGTLTIDPAQLTEIHHVKPTKGFARIAHLLTGGLVKTKEERETFCAITILQQVNIVMRAAGIDNIVRLSKDHLVLYEDLEGKEGDLKEAIDAFASKVSSEDVKLFNTLDLVLEQTTKDLTILIDIRINRSHEIGEHPIVITVNGLPNDLSAQDGEGKVRKKMKSIFSSQKRYDQFVERHQASFESLLGNLKASFAKHMSVDDAMIRSNVRIIRPKQRVNSRADVPFTSDAVDPIYENHYGAADHFFFAWIWADYCFANETHCQDVTIVDPQGQAIVEVGEAGFDAGHGNALNVDEDFSLPESNDMTVIEGSSYAADISYVSSYSPSMGVDPIPATSGDGGGGWFSSISDSVGGMDFGGSSCGSSCGGGCGGGGD